MVCAAVDSERIQDRGEEGAGAGQEAPGCLSQAPNTLVISTFCHFSQLLQPVLRIRIRFRIHMFLGLPDPDPLVRGMDLDPALDPDPSSIMQK